MRSWIAELLMPWLALKLGGRESKAAVCVYVSTTASADIPHDSTKFIHWIRAVCL